MWSGEQKRRKYQDEQAKPPIVSVSRSAGPPHVGQVVLTHSAARASGERPEPSGVKSTISGSSTGSCSSGIGTSPCVGQKTIGMGAPQYFWREISQSRMR